MDAQNESGRTALHVAIVKGHKDIVQLLVNQGANVNLKIASGDTPLHFAVREGQEETCRLLLARAKEELTWMPKTKMVKRHCA